MRHCPDICKPAPHSLKIVTARTKFHYQTKGICENIRAAFAPPSQCGLNVPRITLPLQAINSFDVQAYINATIGNISNNQQLTPEQIATFLQNKSTIIAVVAAPKSGSTFLSNVLLHTLNLPYMPLCYAYSSNEHDLYFPALVAASINGCVSQLHMKGTPHNAQLMNMFGIRPIVLTRNIFDSIESLARDLRSKFALGSLGEGHYGYSFTWLTDDIASLDDEQLIDFIIEFAAPWYVNQYISWRSMARKRLISPVFLRYEDLMNHKEEMITKLIKEVTGKDVEINPSLLESNFMPGAVGSRGSGRSGLGLERLSPAQVQAIKKLLSYYPSYNLNEWMAAV